MATKIKRSLYIGLGGTGMNALLNAKKLFIETYGELPPMIGFLGVDTDGGAFKKEIDSKMGKIRLEPYEQLSLQVMDPRSFYEVNRNHFSWLSEKNIFALQSMMLGAGQVRSNGRFAITYNYQKMQTQVKNVLDRIADAQISNNPRYELATSDVEIHMIFSVCGGTGCGTFIDAAYLVRQLAPNRKLTGYAVLPDVFESMGNGNAAMARVKPNAYGAILDLDWLMHLQMDSKPVTFDYVSTPILETSQNPFDTVYFIDNRNSNGDIYNHVDQLTDMISLALVTSAGELSSASASVSDNVQKMIAAGTMDVEGKRAWCAGMGVCEILFKGSELRSLYAYKAVKRLIERLFNSCVDSDSIVNGWIDSDTVKIRENGGGEHDDVIDYLLDINPPFQLSEIDNKDSANAEVQDYLNGSGMKGQENIDGKLRQLKERVFDELHKLMVKTINQECGIGAAEAVVLGIQSQVNIFFDEMNKEYKDLTDQQPLLISALDNAIQDLTDYSSKFFKTRSRQQEYADDVLSCVANLARNKRDLLRHSFAISFFTSLQNELVDQYTKIQNIKRLLSNVNDECTNAISRIVNQVNRETQIFQIDLAKEFVGDVAVNDNDLLITDLLKEFEGDKLFSLDTMHSEDVLRKLTDFASRLKAASVWEGMTIDNVLDKMSPAAFEHVVRMAINKSKPLIQYDDRGHRPMVAPTDSYYIGVPDKLNSRLFKDDYFKKKIENPVATVDFANLGTNDRVIIYRQFGVFPAFHIATLQSYKPKYDRSTVSCHLDQNMLNRMIREDYRIEPTPKADDSLGLWIQGLIFGLIKNEDGHYQYQNTEEGDPLFDYWMELSEYRDEAYQEFKRHIETIHDEYEALIEEIGKKNGSEYMDKLLQDVKENYFEKYSQINMDKKQITAKGYEPIRQLITEEISFVKKEL
ncbi:MAG: hypothetical protein IKX59_10380 [Bacteroidales bacterium]|nr:hypothetical protein [Bacteroidales bacterium]